MVSEATRVARALHVEDSHDITGLEMCAGREACTDFAAGDVWTPVDPIEGLIAVNIGEQRFLSIQEFSCFSDKHQLHAMGYFGVPDRLACSELSRASPLGYGNLCRDAFAPNCTHDSSLTKGLDALAWSIRTLYEAHVHVVPFILTVPHQLDQALM